MPSVADSARRARTRQFRAGYGGPAPVVVPEWLVGHLPGPASVSSPLTRWRRWRWEVSRSEFG